MVDFGNLEVGLIVYIIDDNPITILELKILSFGYSEENTKRMRVANKDLSFEVDFEKIQESLFTDEETAMAYATKIIIKDTNDFISNLTDGFVKDYFDLDKMVEKYKITHPELFI